VKDGMSVPRTEELRTDFLFNFYRANKSDVVSEAGIERFIQDLCRGRKHVLEIKKILGLDRTCVLSRDQFRQGLADSSLLNKALLSPHDLIHVKYPRSDVAGIDYRVVLQDTEVSARADGEFDRISNRISAAAVNHDFVLDAAMLPDPSKGAQEQLLCWRGPLAAREGTEEYQLAALVVRQAMDLVKLVGEESDMLDQEWMVKSSLQILLGTENMSELSQRVVMLSRAARVRFVAQPSLVRVNSPCKIFGDLHGQLRDLLLLFSRFCFPTQYGGDIETTAYVFNGDFVDRGAHQLEVVVLLFALKVLYPSRVFLTRGNHEFREMNERMGSLGFKHVCQYQYGLEGGDQVYQEVVETFAWLPLAALVSSSILVLHGGIGDGGWGLQQLADARRPRREEGVQQDCVHQAMWSDPSDSDAFMHNGIHANPRGDNIATFGPDVTAEFCRREKIELIVRSHQIVRHGYKYMHRGRLLTIFSARNYCEGSNDGAILLISRDDEGNLRVRPKRLVALER